MIRHYERIFGPEESISRVTRVARGTAGPIGFIVETFEDTIDAWVYDGDWSRFVCDAPGEEFDSVHEHLSAALAGVIL